MDINRLLRKETIILKVNYDVQNGEILGFYPKDIAYETIPEPFIEITEAQRYEILNKEFMRIINEEITEISNTEEYQSLEMQRQKELKNRFCKMK